jgi:hypothetical protein
LNKLVWAWAEASLVSVRGLPGRLSADR